MKNANNKYGIFIEIGMHVKHIETGKIIKIHHFNSSGGYNQVWVNPRGKRKICYFHIDNCILPNQNMINGELVTS